MGKGTLVALLRERMSCLGLTVSATTREPRAGEQDGISYHFMDDAEFDRRLAAGEFLEWAWVHAHRYGTLRGEVERVLAGGESVVLEIDVQGGLAVRAAMPDAVLVFVEPPSMEELERRLRGAGHRGPRSRCACASPTPVPSWPTRGDYDVRIVNDDLERACAELEAVIHAYEKDGGPSEDVRDQARD